MKYVFTALGYLFMWCILTPYLVIERTSKLFIITLQIIWYFKLKKEWFKILNTYFVIMPILPIIFYWKVSNLKDFYSMMNWEDFVFVPSIK